MASHRLSVTFYVEGTNSTTGVPARRIIPNTYDYVGQLVGLPRLPGGESNVSYRDRILDVSVNKAGNSYRGIVNGLYRELGLTKFSAVRITPTYSSPNVTVGRSPVLEVKATKVILYEAWWAEDDYIVDREILFYNREDPGYFISDLVARINESDYFSATLLDVSPWMPSQLLLRDRTTKKVVDESVPSSRRFRLKHGNIVSGSIRFSENLISKEVSVNRKQQGDRNGTLSIIFDVTSRLVEDESFNLSPITGEVSTTSLPSGTGSVSYIYLDYPWLLKASDVAVFGLNEEDFWDNMFEKYTDRFDGEHNALPTGEGTDILNQLYSDLPIFWGE